MSRCILPASPVLAADADGRRQIVFMKHLA
jgi:hypothetical protein